MIFVCWLSIHWVERAHVISLREELINNHSYNFIYSTQIHATARGNETAQLCCTRVLLNLYTRYHCSWHVTANGCLSKLLLLYTYRFKHNMKCIAWPPYFYSLILFNKECFLTSVPLCFIQRKDVLMVHLQFPQIPFCRNCHKKYAYLCK